MVKASNVAVKSDKAERKPEAAKLPEKVVEKRRALGRGLESLIPSAQPARTAPSDTELGPRVVTPAVSSSSVSSAGQETATVPAQSEAGRADAPVPSSGARMDTVVALTSERVDLHAQEEGPLKPKEGSSGAPCDAGTAASDESLQGAGPDTGFREGAAPSASSSDVGLDVVAGRARTPVAQPAELRSAGESTTQAGENRADWGPRPGAAVPTYGSVPTYGAGVGGDDIVRLEIDLIDENPHQTRKSLDLGMLEELGQSIRAQGLLQPIVVRPKAEGRFLLILGDRRLRASRMAGLDTIPAVVKRVSEQQAAEMTLVENLQRQDLNCVEQAQAFAKLSQEFHLTQEQIGARVGLSREAVSNYLRLLSLPEGVLGALISGKLTFTHARVMLQLKTKDPVSLWYYAKKAIDHGMSVKKFEDFVLGKFNPPDDRPPDHTKHDMGGGARWVDPNVKAAQRSLEEVLGMRVRIRDRQGCGRILIEYATIDDFDRVVRMLSGGRG